METTDTDRSPDPVDLYVGARIRMRRKLLGISQERLAEQLGLTFQQVQKYERGANRVSASKLHAIGIALGAPVAYFFDGFGGAPAVAGGGEPDGSAFVHELVMTPEGLELATLFPRLRRARVRRRLLDLVRALVEEEAETV